MPTSTTHRRRLRVVALPFLLLAATLAGCVSVAGGGSQPTPHAASSALTPSPLVIPKVTPGESGAGVVHQADVIFSASTDFYSALQMVTNLGLQPVDHCTGYFSSAVRWRAQDYNFRWLAPVAYPEGATPPPGPLHELAVAPAPLAPSDWLQRLAALPSVKSIYDGFSSCPDIMEDLTPVPGALYFLGVKARTEDLRVSFAATGAGGYGQALATISNLGFRLADPCYEQSASPLAWSPVGQQATFASSGALVVAITAANSTQWLAQLKTAPGVVSVQAPYTEQCA